MFSKILILGGRGRIGSSVAMDLLKHTKAQLIVTGRTKTTAASLLSKQDGDLLQDLRLDLTDRASLTSMISSVDLVVHCAGPFRQRDVSVLETCIAKGVNYVDVSDDRVYTQAALELDTAAKAAGITAIVNTGVFPGISNSMVRQGVEQFDTAQDVHISYVVAGSGGAGVTVMRTTFLNIQHPFKAWINSHWQQVEPYTNREVVKFPAPFGPTNVYWFDMPEALTLSRTFPLRTVTTKFGTFPNIYNRLTWLTAHWFPKSWMRQPQFVEALAHISHSMTDITDRFSGTGVAMRVSISGHKNGERAQYSSVFQHENAAVATGLGTGGVSQLILSGQIQKPGVWPVEQAVSTEHFNDILRSRGVEVEQTWN